MRCFGFGRRVVSAVAARFVSRSPWFDTLQGKNQKSWCRWQLFKELTIAFHGAFMANKPGFLTFIQVFKQILGLKNLVSSCVSRAKVLDEFLG
jgi:hypothetical protein